MSTHRYLVAVGLTVVLAAAGTGCSWVMVNQAPENYEARRASAPPECTSSLGPPISDIWDAIAVGGGIAAFGTVSVLHPVISDAVGVAQLVAGGGLGAMFGASAAHGFSSTKRCRELERAFQERLYERLHAIDEKPPSPEPQRAQEPD